MNETIRTTRKVNLPDSDRCANCGQPLPPDAPPDTCPACAIRGAIGLDEEAAASLVGQTFGDYELLKEIARGGMGVVFQARQRSLGRIVALKMILGGRLASEADVRRFKFEAQAAAALRHPNIVAIHEVGEGDGQHFFSMEYVEGRSLADFTHDKLLPARETGRFLERIARAVHYAHQRGIIHRDLKPSNVLVDETGEPHVTDFGLAKFTGQPGQTLTGAVLGTPGFMAPEQAGGRPSDVTEASDVYSLGAMLYQLLTGRPPFQGETPQAVIAATLHSEPVSPSALNASTPPDLETICLKCLDHEVHRRYATAEALADDLAHWLRDEPIDARRVGPLGRFRKWARRKPAHAALAASLVIGIGVSTWLATHATREAGRAMLAEKKALAALAETEKARTAETKAKELAQESDLESREVLQFVQEKVFAAARLEGREGGLGWDVTLRRAMKAALPFVEESFTNRPLTEARLRYTMGTSFLDLGEADIAAEQFEAARRIFAQARGPDHPGTLRSMGNLASTYDALGRREEALKLREETLALMKAKLGADQPDTLTSMNNLAKSYHAVGRREEARKLREETLALMKAKLGPDHPDTLQSMNNLANSFHAVGRREEALKLREDALALMKTNLGPDHPDTLQSMNNLANSYHDLGRREEALKLREDALALQKAKLGPDHPATLASINNLAASFHALGRHEEALKLDEEMLALQKAKLGADHPDTLRSMNNLANSYHALGRREEALKLREEALALRKAKLGADHPDTLRSMNNLANSYHDLGRREEALKLRKETLALMKAKLGADHPDTLTSMNNLAVSYSDLGRREDALKLLEETLTLGKAKLGPDHPDTVVTMNQLATTYIQVKRCSDAETILKEITAAQRKALPAGRSALIGTLDLLGSCLLQQDKHAEAATVLQECMTLSTNRSPDDWTTFKFKMRLGAALLGQKQYAEAETELRQSYEGLEQRKSRIPARDSTRYLKEAAGHLVKLYTERGQPAKAAEWKQKLAELDTAGAVAGRLDSEPKK